MEAGVFADANQTWLQKQEPDYTVERHYPSEIEIVTWCLAATKGLKNLTTLQPYILQITVYIGAKWW